MEVLLDGRSQRGVVEVAVGTGIDEIASHDDVMAGIVVLCGQPQLMQVVVVLGIAYLHVFE